MGTTTIHAIIAYIRNKTERGRDRQTDRPRPRETETETDRQKDRQTDRLCHSAERKEKLIMVEKKRKDEEETKNEYANELNG